MCVVCVRVHVVLVYLCPVENGSCLLDTTVTVKVNINDNVIAIANDERYHNKRTIDSKSMLMTPLLAPRCWALATALAALEPAALAAAVEAGLAGSVAGWRPGRLWLCVSCVCRVRVLQGDSGIVAY